ncbi:helix-turn-helix transcriptional regulator [Paenibacillus sp. O199]|uniref:helix-turn-helix domain-containing protein n=1 Tax=Paenibacillus sp. O199 TaxID=1643925 RepID=UPI0007BF22E1|nr:helix-turn-helix transcriptional regulator [Paenibacillus sp. O199]
MNPSNMSANELGQFLRKLRGKESLRTIAEKSGLSYTYISTIEKGVRPGSNKPIKVTPDALQKLSVAYNHPYEDLLVKAGYLWNQLAYKFEYDENGFKGYTIEETPEDYGVNEKMEENDLQKIMLNNNYLSFEGEILTMEDKIQILDMIPVLLKRRK